MRRSALNSPNMTSTYSAPMDTPTMSADGLPGTSVMRNPMPMPTRRSSTDSERTMPPTM